MEEEGRGRRSRKRKGEGGPGGFPLLCFRGDAGTGTQGAGEKC